MSRRRGAPPFPSSASARATFQGNGLLVEAAGVDGGDRALVAAQCERILFLARDPRGVGVVLRHESGAQVDVRVVGDQLRVRRHLVASHRDEAHRLGAAGDDRAGRPAHDALGREGDRLQARRAEAVDRHRRGRDRNAGPEARDPGDVHALLGLRHGAAEDHVVDLGRVDARGAAQALADGRGGHLVGAGRAERALGGLARGGANGGSDDGVGHGCLPQGAWVAATAGAVAGAPPAPPVAAGAAAGAGRAVRRRRRPGMRGDEGGDGRREPLRPGDESDVSGVGELRVARPGDRVEVLEAARDRHHAIEPLPPR